MNLAICAVPLTKLFRGFDKQICHPNGNENESEFNLSKVKFRTHSFPLLCDQLKERAHGPIRRRPITLTRIKCSS